MRRTTFNGSKSKKKSASRKQRRGSLVLPGTPSTSSSKRGSVASLTPFSSFDTKPKRKSVVNRRKSTSSGSRKKSSSKRRSRSSSRPRGSRSSSRSSPQRGFSTSSSKRSSFFKGKSVSNSSSRSRSESIPPDILMMLEKHDKSFARTYSTSRRRSAARSGLDKLIPERGIVDIVDKLAYSSRSSTPYDKLYSIDKHEVKAYNENIKNYLRFVKDLHDFYLSPIAEYSLTSWVEEDSDSPMRIKKSLDSGANAFTKSELQKGKAKTITTVLHVSRRTHDKEGPLLRKITKYVRMGMEYFSLDANPDMIQVRYYIEL